MEEATASYQAAVTADAARYLLARGIDRETAATFRLGVAADPAPGHAKFAGFLAIPYLGPERQPLSLRFRCLQAHDHRDYGHGKYMAVTDEPGRLFNVAAIARADDEIHLCEGELDAIILNRVGLPAVAVSGSNAWRAHYRRLFAGFNRVWVWADPDEAGAELANRVTRALRTAKPVRLRDGDVTETYQAGGAQALHDLITSASRP
ncbi:toprim domain-containing protein [Actinoplanes sp. NPDC049118]|uniref:toprim domain-containing protein n=1 Tax=Actinoplanes sp. NPDC049118 TaxID=3155769 RepID=UPI0033D1467E